MAEIIRIKCACGNILRVSVEHRGRKGRCPSCKRVIEVPPAPAEAAAKTASAPIAKATEAAPPKENEPPTCKNHPDREATSVCVGCKSFLCEDCASAYRAITFCEECLEDQSKARTAELREAQTALLRDRGVVVGDFSSEFNARSARDALQHALRALTNDGKLLYFAIPVLFSFGSLSACVVGIAAQKGWVWLGLLWLVIAAAIHLFTFAGFVGTAKDVLFGVQFDVGRFMAYSIRWLKHTWPAILLVLLTGFLTGPAIWGEPRRFLRVFLGGVFLCVLFIIALPAVVVVIENKGLKVTWKAALSHLGNNVGTVVGLNLITALFTWMWLYTARGILFRIPVLPDALTGLVVPVIYLAWIIGTISVYLSLSVPKGDINFKAPPKDLPAPKRKPTIIAIIAALVLAVGLGALFHFTVAREEAATSLGKVNFSLLNPRNWSKEVK